MHISKHFSTEAERALLGALLLNPNDLQHLQSVMPLSSAYFFETRHKDIFLAISTVAQSTKDYELVQVFEEWNTPKYPSNADSNYLLVLLSEAPVSPNLYAFGEVITKHYHMRRITHMIEHISHRIQKGDHTGPEQLLGDIESYTRSLMEQTIKGGMTSSAEILTATAASIDARASSGEARGITTGFPSLDIITSGWHPSDLIILAARPGMGKTALALNWLMNAIKAGRNVVFFSLEMSKEQLMERLISSEGMIPSADIRKGRFSQNMISRIYGAIKRLQAITHDKLAIDDTASISLPELTARAIRAHRQAPVHLIMIDYLQLMRGPKEVRGVSREREVAEISTGLKALAKELKVPIIALAQLNRSPDARQDKRPRISDLRESGSVEQDADLVTFIYREEYYNPDCQEVGTAELIIGKNRHGPISRVYMRYEPEYVTFRSQK